MRKLTITLILLLFALCLEAQDCTELKNDPEIRPEIQDLANSAANKLKDCCSSRGGTNIKAEIHWDKDEFNVCQTRISKISNRITITMTASWNGSLTGFQYWIKGRLIIEGNSKSWEKISDSGGFSNGCGKSCIY
jgi:hypothetical protein